MINQIQINNLKDQLKFMGDIELQRLSWFGKHKEIFSSFDETVEMLYDFDFANFIKSDQLDKELGYNLECLDKMIEDYGGKDTDKEVIEDENWLKIVNQARKCLTLWN